VGADQEPGVYVIVSVAFEPGGEALVDCTLGERSEAEQVPARLVGCPRDSLAVP
jgi:hypothetical protein